MAKVYSHENLALVHNAKALLELSGIDSEIRNEYHASGGHVGFEAIPIELWVRDATQARRAIEILERELEPDRVGSEWLCQHCGEKNGDSFETCWRCQKPRQPG